MLRVLRGTAVALLDARTMRRPTTVLIVMLLAGAPGVSLGCELWCSTPAAETHHRAVGCHRTPDEGLPGEQVVSAAAGCHNAPAVTPFVNEGRQPETRPVAMASVHGTPTVFANHDFTHESWSVFNGQSVHAQSFRTILRI